MGYSIYMENKHEHEHQPEPGDQYCKCGAQEVFFEGRALDPGDLGPVVGYGCDAEGHPYRGFLDRKGWHISPSYRDRVHAHFTDEDFNAMTDDEFDKVMRYERTRR